MCLSETFYGYQNVKFLYQGRENKATAQASPVLSISTGKVELPPL
jgi:hypothetical protein